MNLLIAEMKWNKTMNWQMDGMDGLAANAGSQQRKYKLIALVAATNI